MAKTLFLAVLDRQNKILAPICTDGAFCSQWFPLRARGAVLAVCPHSPARVSVSEYSVDAAQGCGGLCLHIQLCPRQLFAPLPDPQPEWEQELLCPAAPSQLHQHCTDLAPAVTNPCSEMGGHNDAAPGKSHNYSFLKQVWKSGLFLPWLPVL